MCDPFFLKHALSSVPNSSVKSINDKLLRQFEQIINLLQQCIGKNNCTHVTINLCIARRQ